MSQTMNAVEITEPGGPDVLQMTTRPVPEAGVGDVVIRLAYAGVNRPDALQRAGLYAPPPTASDLPGLEGAGEIVSVGAGVSDWSVGDKVCALLPGGGYAEYVATPAAHCLPIPAGMPLDQAACLPATFFTVWSNVFMRGGLGECRIGYKADGAVTWRMAFNASAPVIAGFETARAFSF